MNVAANWFIGFPVAGASWLDGLESVPVGVRLFHPDDLHVTLAFLGPVGRTAAERGWTTALLAMAGGGLGRWRFVPGALHAFGDPKKPSAWSVEPEPRVEALEAFITAHRGPILEAGQGRPDRRPARPHATLVRPRTKASPAEHEALKQWAQRQVIPRHEVEVGAVALYTWSESRRERLFQVVASSRL
jgi:2'-5' RNA ligase